MQWEAKAGFTQKVRIPWDGVYTEDFTGELVTQASVGGAQGKSAGDLEE